MSLAGKLEDLGLGEIFQIVSLSRKTGVLSLNSRGRNGSVFFRKGQIVRASSSTCRQTLGQVLIQKGAITPALLRKALLLQQEQGFRELLGVILVNEFSVSQSVVSDIVREHIEKVVFSLFGWDTGDFSFTPQDDHAAADEIRMDPSQFMLDQGLNPQFLAMESSRLQDLKSDSTLPGSDADSSPDVDPLYGSEPAEPTLPAPSSAFQQPVIVVDDDGPTLKAITGGLSRCGLVVHTAGTSEEALAQVEMLLNSGKSPFLLIDLIMPKMDGSGVLGGIELLERLHDRHKSIRIVVMSDYSHAESENKVHEMGFRFMLKPRRIEIGTPEKLQDFIDRLRDHISCSRHPASHGLQNHYNLGDELRNEMETSDGVQSVSESAGSKAGLSLLRGMLEELNNPDVRGGLHLLILRFASEFFDRAIIFTITDGILSGSGQFGITNGVKNGDELVRAIHFPLDADSIFMDSGKSVRSGVFKPKMTPFDRYLFEFLGGGVPEEVFIGPIVSQSRLIGFLYGDTMPDRRPIVDLEPLSIFLSQAGIAMEKSLLEQRLFEGASA